MPTKWCIYSHADTDTHTCTGCLIHWHRHLSVKFALQSSLSHVYAVSSFSVALFFFSALCPNIQSTEVLAKSKTKKMSQLENK